MIFYFTGTGNSLYAANHIAEAQGERLISIARLMSRKEDVYHFDMGENELLGFAFPVFAWGPPKMVLDFISKLDVAGKALRVFPEHLRQRRGKNLRGHAKGFGRKGAESRQRVFTADAEQLCHRLRRGSQGSRGGEA